MGVALYRKYRPQTFDDVVGQEFITSTLKNEVAEKTFSHAYLFTGTRGTGKTSCARILARAINCPNASDGEPCNTCEICRGILDGSVSDVTEIDAASNSSVDNIRQMRDEIAYLPVSGAYKIYIIDEVHMLSGAAFNALLKTLEEPPEHVVFILATTEVHKVPATVLSRCQRFDFRRIPTETIADRLWKIVQAEGGKPDRDACRLVAELGDGSMRDSISVLEKVIRLSDRGEIENVLGVVDRGSLHGLMEAAVRGDTAAVYETVDRLYTASKELSVLCAELLGEYRAVLLVKSSGDYRRLIDRSDRDCEALEALASSHTTEQILYAMDLLQSTLTSLSRSTNKRSDVELCLLRIARPSLCPSPEAMLARISALEEKLKNGTAPAAPKPEPEKKAEPLRTPPVKKPEPAEKPAERVPEKKPETKAVPEPKTEYTVPADGGRYQELIAWKEICREVRSHDVMLGLTLQNETCCVYRGRDFFILCTEEQDRRDIADPKALEHIRRAFAAASPVRGDFTLQVVIGRKGDYLSDGSLYDHVETSDLFRFDDER